MIVWFYAAGTDVDLGLAGTLGAAGWIACAIAAIVLVLTGQFRKQPELDGTVGRMLSAPRRVADGE